MTGSCEYGNETSGSIRGGYILVQYKSFFEKFILISAFKW